MTDFALTLIASFLPVVLVHEAGHELAIWSAGETSRPTFTRRGPGILWNADGRSARVRAYVTLAGPLMNLLMVPLFWRSGWHLAAAMSFDFGVMTLIPSKRSDGGRALRALRGRA